MVKLVLILSLLSFSTLAAQAREFTCQDTYEVALAGANNHLNHPAVDGELIAKSIYPYLDHKDPDRLYLTESEYQGLIKQFTETKQKTYEALKAGACTGYKPVDEAVAAGRTRWLNIVKGVLAETTYPELDINRREGTELKRLNSEAEFKDYARYLVKRYLDIETHKTSGKKITTVKEAKTKFENKFFKEKRKAHGPAEEQAFLVTKSLFLSLDPHSSYMTEEEGDDMRANMSANLEGIGADLTEDDLGARVIRLTPNSPAARSKKIKPGDIMVKVNQRSIADAALSEIVKQVRGPKGTKVTITFSRKDKKTNKDTLFDVVLVRDSISLDNQRVQSKIIKQGDKNILVFNLPGFYADHRSQISSTYDLISEYNKQRKTGPIDGLVLDLRNNPGGLLDEAIRIVGLFIDQPLSVQVKDLQGVRHFKSKTGPVLMKEPLVVLINKGSASASEIVAGALKDYGRAVIVGDERTYGKGTIQSVIDSLKTQKLGSYKVTIAKFYTPAGSSTQEKGVAADIIVPSATQIQDIGEKNQKFALTWSEVASAFKQGVKTSVTECLPQLRQRSAERIQKNRSFDKYQSLSTYEQWKKQEDKKKLTEVKAPAAESTEEEEENAANERNRFDLEKDLVLQEGLAIELDLINQIKDSPLPMAAVVE